MKSTLVTTVSASVTPVTTSEVDSPLTLCVCDPVVVVFTTSPTASSLFCADVVNPSTFESVVKDSSPVVDWLSFQVLTNVSVLPPPVANVKAAASE